MDVFSILLVVPGVAQPFDLFVEGVVGKQRSTGPLCIATSRSWLDHGSS
jgi:hypothetical protein